MIPEGFQVSFLASEPYAIIRQPTKRAAKTLPDFSGWTASQCKSVRQLLCETWMI